MLDLSFQLHRIVDLEEHFNVLRGYLDYEKKAARLKVVLHELETPDIWKDPEKAQLLGKERSSLQTLIKQLDYIASSLHDVKGLLELAVADNDEAAFESIVNDINALAKQIDELEFRRMFSGKLDANNAYMDIQSGSGGTEAQDWAEMILRMYLKWGDKHHFSIELIEVSPGEVAGIKSATVKFSGDYAYGWLKTETGVHRLVRKSPFDANNKRHTSFASVFVYPEVAEDIEIEINPADLRIDTYRSSGAGGQHVNVTDSAIRIKHLPSGIIVQCQSERSQHQNRAQAMKQLRAKLYELELRKKRAEQEALEASKLDITWGSQIRSYVLDDSRIKDLRTGVETRNTQAVLDGGLDIFIESSLKQGNN